VRTVSPESRSFSTRECFFIQEAVNALDWKCPNREEKTPLEKDGL
jgi:hypothetical protein